MIVIVIERDWKANEMQQRERRSSEDRKGGKERRGIRRGSESDVELR